MADVVVSAGDADEEEVDEVGRDVGDGEDDEDEDEDKDEDAAADVVAADVEDRELLELACLLLYDMMDEAEGSQEALAKAEAEAVAKGTLRVNSAAPGLA